MSASTLSRRQIASKLASIFDLTGKLAPVIMGLKADRREVILATESWDDAVPQNLCGKWVKNLWKLEQLRGMKFHQPIIPGNAINCVLRPITAVDASLDAMIMGCWVCFELSNGGWSCQLIIGRGLLAPENRTVPKNELKASARDLTLLW